MPRIARAVFAGRPHHVTQRGNYRQVVFEDDGERLEYLEWLCHYKQRHGLKVLAWCLMDNHVHLVCVPGKADSLSKTLHYAHMRYANASNRRRGQQGHLWQGRFYSCVLEGRHLAAAVRYVERNAVRARIVRYAENYRWSSAAFHVKGKADGVTDATGRFGDVTEGIRGGWKAWLRLGDEKDYCEGLRSCTRTGRPFGAYRFVKRLEAKSGRTLHALPRGRPRQDEST